MTDYIGFFVRDNLGQVPNQTGSSWSSCPDIIFAGATPPPNPAQYTTAASYATDYGSNIYASVPPSPNYVYVRALNTNPAASATTPITGRAWYYWVESDLAMWPQNWNSYLTTVAAQPINYQDIVTTANNQVVMCDLPFIWSPPPPATNTHYCAVLWIENTPVNPPQNPVAQIGAFNTFNDLVNFVLAHPNMGWRNTTNVGSLGYTWTQTTAVTGPAQAPGLFYLGIQCNNMPTDGQLGYQIPGPTPNIAPIVSNLTPISNPNMLNLVPITGWPANAKSSITIDYKQGATTPPTGANVVVTLIIPNSSMTKETHAMLAAAPDYLKLSVSAELVHNRNSVVELEAVDDIFGAVIGTMTYGF
jgi:hypothetical protein